MGKAKTLSFSANFEKILFNSDFNLVNGYILTKATNILSKQNYFESVTGATDATASKIKEFHKFLKSFSGFIFPPLCRICIVNVGLKR